MSYQVLARKWRPASFEQVVGQSHVLHALVNALNQQRLHHAYLFTGTRGVGKTSLARLFAKGLNCEQGITATPCGKCSACQEIAQGRFVDLIEVDAASRTKVDDTRELLDNVQYRPTRGRFKVYLIDEVHMLSRSSFNALLKTLEEPPEHVKFLLATTDPQKLPVTVLSRCLQFNLKSLTQDEIAKQLQHIVTAEALPFEAQALTLLAKAANGSMRDALSLTDQAIAFGAGQIKLQQVQTMLGAIDERQVVSLLQALINADIAPLMQEAERILAFGADANEVLRSLLELLHQITLTQFAPAAAQLSLYATQIQEFAQQLSAEQVQLYYQLLLQGRKDLPFAPDPKSGLEMALLRTVAFVPETSPKRWGEVGTKTTVTMTTPAAVTSIPVSQPVRQLEPVLSSIPNNELAETSALAAAASSVSAINDPAAEVAEVIDDDDENDGAFAAEQSLILSQAESMGHRYQAEPSVADIMSDSAVDLSDDEPPFKDELTTDMFATEMSVDVEASSTDDNESALSAAVSEPLFGDDVLDQVLATRDLLLQDIDALANDEAPVVISEHHQNNPSKKNAESSVKEIASANDMAASNDSLSVEASSCAVDEAGEDDNGDVYSDWLAQSTEIESDQTLGPSALLTDEAIENAAPLDATMSAATISSSDATVNSNIDVTAADKPVAVTAMAAPSGNPADLAWYKLVSAMPIRGRVRQLAANSVCLSLTEKCTLVLKPDQKHLAAVAAISQLQEALAEALQRPLTVEFSVGSDSARETPQEIRQRFKNELLADAEQKLMADANVRWLKQHMGADLVPDSLSYNPEQLAHKTALIPDGQLPQ